MNPKPNKKGLKPFKKGQSGNPNGRPKGTENSSTRLKRILEIVQKRKNPATGQDEDFTVLEQMDLAMIAKALKGDTKAYAEILDRFEGKSKQVNINIERKLGADLSEEVKYD